MIIVVTPIVGIGWPALLPIVLAVAGGFGYKRLTEENKKAWMRGQLTNTLENTRLIRIQVEKVVLDAVGDEVARDQVLRFVNDDYVLVVRRDARNELIIEVLAPKTKTIAEMKRIGNEFAAEIAQMFIYNRTVQEFERRGVMVVGEEENEEGSIILNTRKWD